MGGDAGQDKLNSWKAIAEFLDRDVRTVQRWESVEGMPVHRRMHLKRASVWAYGSELQKWWEGRKDLAGVSEPESSPEPPSAVPSLQEPPPDAVPPRKIITSGLGWLGLVCLLPIGGIILWGVRIHSPSIEPPQIGRLFARSTREGARLERIAVGKAPIHIAATPDGSELYVCNYGDGTVSVIQTSTRKVTHTLSAGDRPHTLVIAPDGRKVYVANEVSGLTAIETKTKNVSTISTGGRVNSMAITLDGQRLYMAMTYTGLKRFWIATGKLESIPVVGCPYGLALDPSGKRLYVSYRCGGPGGRPGWDAIDVIDLEREASLATVNGLPLVGGPIAVTPNGSQIWVSGSDRCSSNHYNHSDCPTDPGGIMHVLRSSDLKHLAALGLAPIASLSPQPYPSFFPDSSRVILAGSGLVEVRDTATFTVLERLENTLLVGGVIFSPGGRTAFVAQNSPDGVLVIEPEPADCQESRLGLYHLWPADGNTSDTQGQNHGKALGGVRFAPGLRGQALSLEGTGKVQPSVDRGFLNGMLPGLDWTVAAWAKPASTDVEGMVMGSAAESYTWGLGQAKNGHWQFETSSLLLESRTRVQANRWHHVAATHTGGVFSLYIDGVKQGTVAAVHPSHSPGISATIGADPRGGKFFRGLIDEVRIYQAALPERMLRSMARGERSLCEETASTPTR